MGGLSIGNAAPPFPFGVNPRLANIQAGQENQNHINQNQEDKFVTRNRNGSQRKSFNLFNFAGGLIKGFFKEVFAIVTFLPVLAFNLITNPVGTIKGFVNGFKALASLLLNPDKLMETLKNAWEHFKNCDSEKQGEIIGRIICNFIPLPIIGNPLLLNARLISMSRRIGTGAAAIAKNAGVLSRFYRKSGGSKWKTFLAARKIAKKANLKKDFQRALKLEGIPAELAPKLRLMNLPGMTGGMYMSNMHTIIINKRMFNILPSGKIGTFIRHEVKHAGQALSLPARSARNHPPLLLPVKQQLIKNARNKLKQGCTDARIDLCNKGHQQITKKMEYRWFLKEELAKLKKLKQCYKDIYFLPESVWSAAAKHPKLKIKTKIPPQDIIKRFTEANKLGRKASSWSCSGEPLMKIGNRVYKNYIKQLQKVKARKYGVATECSIYLKIGSTALARWLKTLIKRIKKYKSCPLEAEAFRVQARYIGLAPRIYLPSIHNIPRLTQTLTEIINNLGGVYNERRINQDQNANAADPVLDVAA